jgi:hypothetical protein
MLHVLGPNEINISSWNLSGTDTDVYRYPTDTDMEIRHFRKNTIHGYNSIFF